MNKISVFLFDIGNVLIGWDQSRLLNKVFQSTGTQDTPEVRQLFAQWNDHWDAGDMHALSAHEIASHPHLEPAIRAYCDFWPLSLDPVLDEVFDIAQEVKTAGYRLYTASNFATDNFALTLPRMPRLSLFDAIHISGTSGKCKPSLSFFQEMMEKYSFNAEDALFIDDRPVNIEGAARAGIQGHLFTSASNLRADLVAKGLLSGP